MQGCRSWRYPGAGAPPLTAPELISLPTWLCSLVISSTRRTVTPLGKQWLDGVLLTSFPWP